MVSNQTFNAYFSLKISIGLHANNPGGIILG